MASLLAAGLIAGDKTNYSGEWIFNDDKSQLDEMDAQFIPAKLILTQEKI